jgi:hypothetical protein
MLTKHFRSELFDDSVSEECIISYRLTEISLYLAFPNELNVAQKEKHIDE